MGGPHPLDKEQGPNAKPIKAESVGAKKIPLYEGKRPHKLDGDVGVAVFLRQIYEKTHIDDHLKGDARKAKIIYAADDASELVKEIVQLVALQKPDWHEVDTELAHALRGMHHVEAEAPDTEKKRIAKAREDLEHIADKRVFAAAEKELKNNDELPAMNDKERLEMAAQAVIAACRQAALFTQQKEKTVDIAHAQEYFAHMRLHYDTATNAVSGISDTRLILRLNSDIELATQGMDKSEQLVLLNKLPWDRTIAAAFDAERRFLIATGLDKQLPQRKYSGTIDPNTAIQNIQNVAEGKSSEKWSQKAFDNPEQAVTGIGVVMDEVFLRQQRAVDNATSDIKEPRVPKESSFLDTLLEILIKTALAGAAGAIGAKVLGLAKGRIEKALGDKAVSSADYFTFRDKGMDALQKEAIATGAAVTSMKAAAAQDATKEFFKTAGYKAIMAAIGSHGKPSSNSADPLNIFKQQSQRVFDDARLEGRMAFVHLAPALNQAEPKPLYELYQALLNGLDEFYEIQYNFVMQEWQNFKARAHYGVADDHAARDKHLYDEKDAQSAQDKAAGKAPPKQDKNAGSDAKIGDGVDEVGTLLVEATVITDDFIGEPGAMTIDKVRLPDAEDATLRHFKHLMRDGKKLQDLQINKHFRFKFVMYMTEHEVNVGVGPDHGLLESTLSDKELAVLRVAASGDRVTNSNVIVAMNGTDEKYNHFTKGRLHGYLKKFIKKAEMMRIPYTFSR